jgi:LmbE family N-acetylglucosaminyl deacetylase
LTTLVCFHAHPDDEAIATGGTLARAVREGHTVVLVVATGGEHGDDPGNLAPGETLADRRRKETEESCRVLGIQHLEWLGYSDSGMTGWDQNAHPEAFVNATVDEAGRKLADIIEKYGATVLTTYDWHGNYGHPDHIMVHKVGYRAAAMAGVTEIFEATVNRDAMRQLQAIAKESGLVSEEDAWDVDGPADDGNPVGLPESELTHRVDVSSFVALKREAIMKHASQMGDTSFFTRMSPETFAAAFGAEWFRKSGDSEPLRDGWLFS